MLKKQAIYASYAQFPQPPWPGEGDTAPSAARKKTLRRRPFAAGSTLRAAAVSQPRSTQCGRSGARSPCPLGWSHPVADRSAWRDLAGWPGRHRVQARPGAAVRADCRPWPGCRQAGRADRHQEGKPAALPALSRSINLPAGVGLTIGRSQHMARSGGPARAGTPPGQRMALLASVEPDQVQPFRRAQKTRRLAGSGLFTEKS